MPTYSVIALNIGSFALGESDKVVTLFSRERGIIKAVAKGARKPGSKIAGRADVLNINRLLLARGKTFEIISQAENLESFRPLRSDLSKLAYGLYFAELIQHFGPGLESETEQAFDTIRNALAVLSQSQVPHLVALSFQIALLNLLGQMPELNHCVCCRDVLTEYRVQVFHHELGGIVCETCDRQRFFVSEARVGYQIENEIEGLHRGYFRSENDRASNNGSSSSFRSSSSSESSSSSGSSGASGSSDDGDSIPDYRIGRMHITPLVWKRLISSAHESCELSYYIDSASLPNSLTQPVSANLEKAGQAADRLIQSYIESISGKRMRSLQLLNADRK